MGNRDLALDELVKTNFRVSNFHRILLGMIQKSNGFPSLDRALAYVLDRYLKLKEQLHIALSRLARGDAKEAYIASGELSRHIIEDYLLYLTTAKAWPEEISQAVAIHLNSYIAERGQYASDYLLNMEEDDAVDEPGMLRAAGLGERLDS